jgi:hypothetical protein
MIARYASLIAGLLTGLVLAFFLVLAVTGGGASREPDPTFDSDVFDSHAVSPTPRITEAWDGARRVLDSVIERLETLREEVQAAARALPLDLPTPVLPEIPQDASFPDKDACETQRSVDNGVARTEVHCEQRVVTEGVNGSVSISSSSSTTVSSTSADAD